MKTKQDFIGYKELYELIDERFNKFEDKLDDRIGQLHDRIDKVHIRITEHIKETDQRFKPIEKTVQKLWIYAGIAAGALAIAVDPIVNWIKKQIL